MPPNNDGFYAFFEEFKQDIQDTKGASFSNYFSMSSEVMTNEEWAISTYTERVKKHHQILGELSKKTNTKRKKEKFLGK